VNEETEFFKFILLEGKLWIETKAQAKIVTEAIVMITTIQ
jgi:hypothetical protein